MTTSQLNKIHFEEKKLVRKNELLALKDQIDTDLIRIQEDIDNCNLQKDMCIQIRSNIDHAEIDHSLKFIDQSAAY